jgi:protoporphyrinogen oxidase
MSQTDVLIIGAGITGLSCGYYLREKGVENHLIVEKQNHIGGLCSSIIKDGFTFDWSGHLLHLHTQHGKDLVNSLLKDNLSKLTRKAFIRSNGVYTKYPFQMNLYGLPQRVVNECVLGVLKTRLKNERFSFDDSFEKWAKTVFGPGICKHFMYPYNRKLWKFPLSKLTANWCSPFVPRPSVEDVIKGAYSDSSKKIGYNATFSYPKKGGIGALCNALAKNQKNIRLNCSLERVDLKNKTAFVKGMGQIRFKKLVNTSPIKEFVSKIENCPADIKAQARNLKCTPVQVLNVGIKKSVKNKHWIYFPERKFPFYRVGFANNFSDHVSPKGTSSLYVEVSGRKINKAEVFKSLKNLGLIKKNSDIVTSLHLNIPYGYVIYDKQRTHALKKITDHLVKNDCFSIGRYGAWKYSFMEESILDAHKTIRYI